MESVDWVFTWSVVLRGIGLVFGIMILLALITHFLGIILQGVEARRKAQAKAEGV